MVQATITLYQYLVSNDYLLKAILIYSDSGLVRPPVAVALFVNLDML